MNISTQLALNWTRLPMEILDIVKNYVFYDIKTTEIMNLIKTKKMEICSIITHARTRASVNCDTGEYWYWCSRMGPFIERIQLCGCNCSKCGEYKTSFYPTTFPVTMLCRCIQEEEVDYDNNYYSDGEEYSHGGEFW